MEALIIMVLLLVGLTAGAIALRLPGSIVVLPLLFALDLTFMFVFGWIGRVIAIGLSFTLWSAMQKLEARRAAQGNLVEFTWVDNAPMTRIGMNGCHSSLWSDGDDIHVDAGEGVDGNWDVTRSVADRRVEGALRFIQQLNGRLPLEQTVHHPRTGNPMGFDPVARYSRLVHGVAVRVRRAPMDEGIIAFFKDPVASMGWVADIRALHVSVAKSSSNDEAESKQRVVELPLRVAVSWDKRTVISLTAWGPDASDPRVLSRSPMGAERAEAVVVLLRMLRTAVTQIASDAAIHASRNPAPPPVRTIGDLWRKLRHKPIEWPESQTLTINGKPVEVDVNQPLGGRVQRTRGLRSRSRI